MCPGRVVIRRVAFQGTTQVGLAEYDDVVGAVATVRSDQPFGDAVLPGGLGRDRLVADAHCSQTPRHNGSVDLIPITDEVAPSFIPGKRLRDLTRDPFGGRMRSYVDPEELSPGRPNDDEDVQPSRR